MTTKTTKPTITLAKLAAQLKMSPKVARAKFRRQPKARPFDHRKVSTLTAQQVAAAKKFLATDFRAAA